MKKRVAVLVTAATLAGCIQGAENKERTHATVVDERTHRRLRKNVFDAENEEKRNGKKEKKRKDEPEDFTEDHHVVGTNKKDKDATAEKKNGKKKKKRKDEPDDGNGDYLIDTKKDKEGDAKAGVMGLTNWPSNGGRGGGGKMNGHGGGRGGNKKRGPGGSSKGGPKNGSYEEYESPDGYEYDYYEYEDSYEYEYEDEYDYPPDDDDRPLHWMEWLNPCVHLEKQFNGAVDCTFSNIMNLLGEKQIGFTVKASEPVCAGGRNRDLVCTVPAVGGVLDFDDRLLQLTAGFEDVEIGAKIYLGDFTLSASVCKTDRKRDRELGLVSLDSFLAGPSRYKTRTKEDGAAALRDEEDENSWWGLRDWGRHQANIFFDWNNEKIDDVKEKEEDNTQGTMKDWGAGKRRPGTAIILDYDDYKDTNIGPTRDSGGSSGGHESGNAGANGSGYRVDFGGGSGGGSMGDYANGIRWGNDDNQVDYGRGNSGGNAGGAGGSSSMGDFGSGFRGGIGDNHGGGNSGVTGGSGSGSSMGDFGSGFRGGIGDNDGGGNSGVTGGGGGSMGDFGSGWRGGNGGSGGGAANPSSGDKGSDSSSMGDFAFGGGGYTGGSSSGTVDFAATPEWPGGMNESDEQTAATGGTNTGVGGAGSTTAEWSGGAKNQSDEIIFGEDQTTNAPTRAPSQTPTSVPSADPSRMPSFLPSVAPSSSNVPSLAPSISIAPTVEPSAAPSAPTVLKKPIEFCDCSATIKGVECRYCGPCDNGGFLFDCTNVVPFLIINKDNCVNLQAVTRLEGTSGRITNQVPDFLLALAEKQMAN